MDKHLVTCNLLYQNPLISGHLRRSLLAAAAAVAQSLALVIVVYLDEK